MATFVLFYVAALALVAIDAALFARAGGVVFAAGSWFGRLVVHMMRSASYSSRGVPSSPTPERSLTRTSV
jgi:hypothetical protein